MNSEKITNTLLMQSLWFAAVIGAAENIPWIAPLLLLLMLMTTIKTDKRVIVDLKLMLVALLLGFILDTSWINLGWLEFAANWPTPNHAPMWILILWTGLALTLNHSLSWLQAHLFLAGLLGGISSPLSYLAASHFGAVTITDTSGMWMIGIGAGWAVVLPLLLWLARQLRQLEQGAQAHV
ncbi:MAG: DUF2878 domain-containing protein [Methylococcales bacterium]